MNKSKVGLYTKSNCDINCLCKKTVEVCMSVCLCVKEAPQFTYYTYSSLKKLWQIYCVLLYSTLLRVLIQLNKTFLWNIIFFFLHVLILIVNLCCVALCKTKKKIYCWSWIQLIRHAFWLSKFNLTIKTEFGGYRNAIWENKTSSGKYV